MKRFINNDTYNIIYENLKEFFDNTDPKNPSPEMNRDNQNNHREMEGDRSWRYGDEETKAKFYDVRFDAAKGKKLCEQDVKSTMADKKYKKLLQQALTYRKRIKFEDSGFRLNVPKAISGEDKYFGVFKNSKRPIVKIAINICGSACVDQNEFRKVARTAIPTIYALETAGISTEVYYIAAAKDTHPDAARYTVTHVKIKSAKERFNWTTFAPVFCLGSYRESIFMSWINSEHEVSSGLGRPMENREIADKNNFGYTSVIGLNGAGPINVVNEIFSKIQKKEC
jgi:hypothetical protein